MIACFVVWQSGREEGSDVVRLRTSLDGGEISCKDSKSGVDIGLVGSLYMQLATALVVQLVRGLA